MKQKKKIRIALAVMTDALTGERRFPKLFGYISAEVSPECAERFQLDRYTYAVPIERAALETDDDD